MALTDVGDRLRDRGDLVKAESYLSNAVKVWQKLNSNSLFVAETFHDLGTLYIRQGDLPRAEEYHRKALAIRQRLAPSSTSYAESLADIAEITRRKGQPEVASKAFAEALSALESQISNLGGTEEVRSGFRAEHAEYYRRFTDLLVSIDQPRHAFAVVESLHARSLLETLAASRADIYQGVEPRLLQQRRSLLASLHAETNKRVKLLGEKPDDSQVQLLDKKIKDLLEQFSQVQAQIRSTSPAYAALTQPQPLTAKEVQSQLLDENTLLLEYSLGEERSYVFAVTPDSLQAFELPKRAVVEKASRRVYSLLTARNVTVKRRDGNTETVAHRAG